MLGPLIAPTQDAGPVHTRVGKICTHGRNTCLIGKGERSPSLYLGAWAQGLSQRGGHLIPSPSQGPSQTIIPGPANFGFPLMMMNEKPSSTEPPSWSCLLGIKFGRDGAREQGVLAGSKALKLRLPRCE